MVKHRVGIMCWRAEAIKGDHRYSFECHNLLKSQNFVGIAAIGAPDEVLVSNSPSVSERVVDEGA